MLSLKEYISEAIDVDNLIWKIETYFKTKPKQKDEFMKLVKKQNENHIITDEDIDNFIEKSGVDMKKLVDFLSEEIDDEIKDYKYLLKKIIENSANQYKVQGI